MAQLISNCDRYNQSCHMILDKHSRLGLGFWGARLQTIILAKFVHVVCMQVCCVKSRSTWLCLGTI